jgi:hypothetical protein
MRSTMFRFILAAGSAATLAGTASAHHSFSAEFDSAKPVTVSGVITKVRLVNPHSWIYLDVKNKDGSVTNWGFEFSTPSGLREKGLGREDLKPGGPIRIDGYRAKNGGAFGYSRLATLPDGRAIQTGGAVDAPAPAAARK